MDTTTLANAATPPGLYHRQARATGRYRWWRPALTVLLSLLFYGGLLLVVGIAVGATMIASPAAADVVQGLNLDALDPAQPLTLFVSFGFIALLLPSVALAVRVAEGRRLGTLSSVAGRLRRPLLVRSLALAAVLFLLLVVPYTVAFAGHGPTWSATTGWVLLCALLVVPFQAAAEEYVFRGLPQQVLGAWLRNPWWGILVPLPLFTFGHPYNGNGLVVIAAMALATGWLTWRTGGLEVAIGLHVVNNALLVVLGGLGLGDLASTEFHWTGALVSLAFVGAYTVLSVRVARGRQWDGASVTAPQTQPLAPGRAAAEVGGRR